MTAKYFGNWRSNRWWFFSLVILLVVTLALSAFRSVTGGSGKLPVNSVANTGQYTGGSECHGYSSEVAPIQPVYNYCENHTGDFVGLSLTQIAENLWHGVVATFTPAPPTKTHGGNNNKTPTPTATGTSVVNIPTVIVTGTPSPEATVPPTENPSETPSVTAPPPTSTEITETATPSLTAVPTKECNNKNDDKKPGENPTDCNAGGGNG